MGEKRIDGGEVNSMIEENFSEIQKDQSVDWKGLLIYGID